MGYRSRIAKASRQLIAFRCAHVLISQGIYRLFAIADSIVSQIAAMLIGTVIFAIPAYAGIGRGLKMLSNINFWLAVGVLAFVLVVRPTVFLLETGLSAIGRITSGVITMATYTESFGGWGDLRQQPGYTGPIINIRDIPHIDPWSHEGATLTRFERTQAEAIAAATAERESRNALIVFQENLRSRNGPFGTFNPDSPPASEEEPKSKCEC